MKKLVYFSIICVVAITTYLSSVDLSFCYKNYFQVLSEVHNIIKPDIYLEIGVDQGRSINLTKENTRAIGIDPAKQPEINNNVIYYNTTSDKFFADKKILNKEFKDKKIDLAFIDGMHLFEYVLRDFINVEKNSNPNSVIVLHDTIPISKETCVRKSKWNGEVWTGDVYKIIPVLKKYRPDLELKILDVSPSGLCFISNLNPQSTVLEENYSKIVDEYMNYSYEQMVETLKKDFHIYKPFKLTTNLMIYSLKK